MRSVVRLIRITFGELLRDKLLYGVLVAGILLLGLSFFAAKLTYVRADRVLADLGLSGIRLSASALAILLGGAVFSKEIERRTLHLVLVRPVSPGEWVIGKCLGVLSLVTLNVFLLSLLWMGLLIVMGTPLQLIHVQAVLLIVLQACVLSSLVLLGSVFSSGALASVVVVGIYLIGVSLDSLLMIAQRTEFPLIGSFFKAVAHLWPDFSQWGVGLRITYGAALSWGEFGARIGYAALWSAIALGIASMGLASRVKES